MFAPPAIPFPKPLPSEAEPPRPPGGGVVSYETNPPDPPSPPTVILYSRRLSEEAKARLRAEWLEAFTGPPATIDGDEVRAVLQFVEGRWQTVYQRPG